MLAPGTCRPFSDPLIGIYRWLRATLQYLQCVSNGVSIANALEVLQCKTVVSPIHYCLALRHRYVSIWMMAIVLSPFLRQTLFVYRGIPRHHILTLCVPPSCSMTTRLTWIARLTINPVPVYLITYELSDAGKKLFYMTMKIPCQNRYRIDFISRQLFGQDPVNTRGISFLFNTS